MRGAVRLSAVITIALLAFPPTVLPADKGDDAQRSGSLGPQTSPPWVSVLNNQQVMGVVGKEVRSNSDEAMGRIVDVLVDRNGQTRGAVIDFGGFLGVGSRKIVVDWGALRFWRVANKRDSITLELTKAQVAAAPEYKEDAPVIVLGAAGRLQPWDFDH